jgi:D-glycero-alpha-D-manno-heptose 1-phosphate guanylyltransferase
MIAIILVGGKENPVHALTTVHSQPFLYWLTLWLKSQDFNHIVYATSQECDEILSWVNHMADSQPDLCLDVVCESRPLGTAGAAALCAKRFPMRDLLIVNGNSILFTPIRPYLKQLKSNPHLDGIIFGTHIANAGRFGSLEVNSQGKLLAFKEKQPGIGPINAGVYLLRDYLFNAWITEKELSFEYDCFPAWLSQGKQFQVVKDNAPFIDIGTPESLRRAYDIIEQNQEVLEECEMCLEMGLQHP